MSLISVLCIAFGLTFKAAECSCDYPIGLQSSTWHDSGKGTLSFSTNQMTGWALTAYSSSVNDWLCYMKNDQYIVSKSISTIEIFSAQYDAYICLEMTKMSEYSYRYYLQHDQQPNLDGNERAYVVGTGSNVNSIQEVCSFTSGPTTAEYHVLLKQGNESSARTWCPSPLLGNFRYTLDDGSGSTACGTKSSWDGCSDRTAMTFNYTLCPTVQAYSQEGEVFCIASIQDGDTYYFSVFNPGTTDEVNYFKFTCYAAQQSGSTVYVSQRAKVCEAGQSARAAPSGGAILTLSPYSFEGYAPSKPEVTSAGVIIGVVIGAVLLTSVIVAAILYKKCCSKQASKQTQKPIPTRRVTPLKTYDADPLYEYMRRGYTFEVEPKSSRSNYCSSPKAVESISENNEEVRAYSERTDSPN